MSLPQLIYDESTPFITDLEGAQIICEDGTPALLVQDEQGNLFIPNILGGFEEEEPQQVVYFTQGDEGESQGVQFVEYVDAQGGFLNENVAVEDNSLESTSSCQYAIVEDSKLLMQEFPNDSELVLNPFAAETPPVVENTEQENTEKENKKIVDISKITGRNLITGQKITLDGYMEKILEQNAREMDLMSQSKRSSKKSEGVSFTTESGKKLKGKIVSIEKKIDPLETKTLTVKKEVMARDVYDYVAKMLIGLMTMESVCKKLAGKNLKIKVVEKTAVKREVSRLCGFMGNTIENLDVWKFFPLKEIEDYKSVVIQNFSEHNFFCNSPYSESTSLTMIISTEAKSGRRTMRVNLTPNTSKRNRPASSNTIKIYKCEHCEKTFKNEIHFEKHKSLHCNICGKMFTAQMNLKRHLASHERDICEKYQCGLCNTALESVAEFNVHLKAHSATRTFQCGVCSREFTRHSNLVRHVAIHKGGSSYQCEICGCTYNFVSSLTRHMVQKHLSSPNCTVTGEIDVQPEELQHEDVELEEKYFS